MIKSLTERLPSSGPNLHNIPIRTEEGSKIRRALTVENDHTSPPTDYSQIELRIAIWQAHDDNRSE